MAEQVTGHWKATEWLINGERSDHELIVTPNGTFWWRRVNHHGESATLAGTWSTAEDDGFTTFRIAPDETVSDFERLDWTVGSVSGCEGSNCLLVLRWLALASRNLPVVFYRVHPTGCECGTHPW